MILSLIVAVAENGVIGKENQLIWHMPSDMKYFMQTTKGHCIITGRKNYESIPEKYRPLSNRTNIIITRQKNYSAPGAIIVHSLNEALEKASNTGEHETFIIGGGEIFKQSMNLVDKIYLTRIHHSFDGDTFFDELNPTDWQKISEVSHLKDEKNPHNYTFIIYERNRN